MLALSGGFIASEEEGIDAAAERELAEETALSADQMHLVECARGKLEYTTLAATFCGTEFTMNDLRRGRTRRPIDWFSRR